MRARSMCVFSSYYHNYNVSIILEFQCEHQLCNNSLTIIVPNSIEKRPSTGAHKAYEYELSVTVQASLAS